MKKQTGNEVETGIMKHEGLHNMGFILEVPGGYRRNICRNKGLGLF